MFEQKAGISAPAFLDRIVATAESDPDADLASEDLARVIDFLTCCAVACGGDARSATVASMLRRAPDLVAQAFREFLIDPIGVNETPAATGATVAVSSVCVCDMYAEWLAAGLAPDVFDRLTLWQHARVMAARRRARSADLTDATVAARMAQAAPKDFSKFIEGLVHGDQPRGLRQSAERLFAATAGLPRISQEELSTLKGTA